MNRIDRMFEEKKSNRKKAFIPFLTAGDPDSKTTEKVILELEAAGADLIELGIPFSDPVADGPTIQRSFVRALKDNTTIDDAFNLVKELRKKTEIPLLFFQSYWTGCRTCRIRF